MTADLAPEFSDDFRTRYRVLRLLGEGGMGRVYEGLHLALDRRVAIKVMLRQTDAVETARFEREGRALATLKHPQILGVYEAGLDGALPYMVSELVEGRTLRDRMEARLGLDAALEIGGGVARALAFAHQNGVLHRDVKPENVFLLGETSVKLGDFGLARNVSHGATVTSPGMVMGTPGYMAPEQLREAAVSPHVDQYALGVMLYEMLAGRLPFVASDPTRALLMRLEKDPPALADLCPEVPRTVTRLVTRMLARDPRERFESLDAMVQALEEICASRDASPEARPAAPEATGRQSASSSRIRPTSASGRFSDKPAVTTAAKVPADAALAQPPRRRLLPMALTLVAGAVLLGLLSGRWIWAWIEDTPAGYVLKVRSLSLRETSLTWTHNSLPARLPLPSIGERAILLDSTLRGSDDLALVSGGSPVIALGPLFDPHVGKLVAGLRDLPIEKFIRVGQAPPEKKALLARAALIMPSWMAATTQKLARFELLNLLYRMEAADHGIAKNGEKMEWHAEDLLPGRWREVAHVPANQEDLIVMHGPTVAGEAPFPVALDTHPITQSRIRIDPRWVHLVFDNYGFVCDDPPRIKIDLIKGKKLEKKGTNLLPFEFDLDPTILDGVREARFGFVAVDPYDSVIVVEINDLLVVRYSLPLVQKGNAYLNGRTRGIPADAFRPGRNSIVVRTEVCPVRDKTFQVYFDSFVLTFYKDTVRGQ